MKLLQSLKKYTIWAGKHRVLALTINVVLTFIMLTTGYAMGVELFGDEIVIQEVIPLVIVGVCVLAVFLLPYTKRKKNGKRRGASIRFRNRISLFTIYSYSAFLLAICAGNMVESQAAYSPLEAWEDWVWYNTANDRLLTAAVVYSAPPVERNTKQAKRVTRKKLKQKRKLKRMERRANRKFRIMQKTKEPQIDRDRRKYLGYIGLGILFIILAAVCAGGACVLFCVGGPVGISMGILATASFLGCIALSVMFFKLAKKGIQEYKAKKKKKDTASETQPQDKKPEVNLNEIGG